MKRLSLALLLGLCAVSAQASDSTTGTTANTQKATVPTTQLVVSSDAAPRTVVDSSCIRETGTKLKRRDANGCTGAAGHAYSRAQIDRTGATDTAGAVRKLNIGRN